MTDIRELPAVYFDAIRTTLIYLGFEEMPEDDQPPRRIWQDPVALKGHFDMLKRDRKARTENGGNTEGPIEEPVQNDLTKGLRG